MSTRLPIRLRATLLNSTFGYFSLSTGLKIFAAKAMLDCINWILTDWSNWDYYESDCLKGDHSCAVYAIDIPLRIVHIISTLIMLKVVCKTSWIRVVVLDWRQRKKKASPHWILGWIFCTLIDGVIDYLAILPPLQYYIWEPDIFTVHVQRALDIYSFAIGLSYYRKETKVKKEDDWIPPPEEVVTHEPVTQLSHRPVRSL